MEGAREPTAGVSLTRAGSLNEDVSGANVLPGNQTIAQPSDAAPSATSYPLAVIYDADGSVLDAGLLVLCCGVRPRIELGRDAGLTIGRGIIVDDRLTTSDPAIIAVGGRAMGADVEPPDDQLARVLGLMLDGLLPLPKHLTHSAI